MNDAVRCESSVNRTAAPACSVCIANYNGEQVLLPCIESVLRQQCAAEIEIIVHDDASTDASVELLQRHYPDIHLIRSSDNVGFCVSNNRMADVARGDYLLLLNNDAVLRDGTLQRLLDAAEGGFRGILSAPQYELGSGRLLDRGCRLDPFLSPVPVTEQGRKVAIVMGACLWIPKALWSQIQGFPAWLESIGEDIFLCLAAWQAGSGTAVIADGGYDHAVGHSFGGGKAVQGRLRTTYRRRFLSERNRICVTVVFCPRLLLPATLIVQLAFMVLEGCAMLLVKREARILREVYLAAMASAWRKRRTVLLERARLRNLFGRFPLRLWFSLFTPIPQKLRLVLRHGIPDVR